MQFYLASLETLFQARIQWLQVHNYSSETVEADIHTLEKFKQWCEARSIHLPQEVTPKLVRSFQQWLTYQKNKNGSRMAVSYQHQVLGGVKRCFKWAHSQGHLLADPTGDITLPKLPRRLPKTIYSVDEIEKILLQPDLITRQGLRDRALMEVFYASAIRRNEALSLHSEDIDRHRNTLWIREGKGRKDRVVPIKSH